MANVSTGNEQGSRLGVVQARGGEWVHVETLPRGSKPVPTTTGYVTWIETAEWLHKRSSPYSFRAFVQGRLTLVAGELPDDDELVGA